MRSPVPVPFDIRFMRMVSSLLFLIFVVMALSALAHLILRHPFFAIRGVTVMGDIEHNNALTLRANVGPHLAGTFFTIDLEAARSAFEAMPWVRQAVVQRAFPNRLKVTLQEQRVAAYWGEEGELKLLNMQGEVFEANLGEIEQEKLPRLSGPLSQSRQILLVYQTLRPQFERLLSLSIEELTLSGRGVWHMRLDNGAQIMLGSGQGEEVVERSWQFAQTLTQVASRYGRTPSALESADLRHEDGYALRLRGVSTLVPAPPPNRK